MPLQLPNVHALALMSRLGIQPTDQSYKMYVELFTEIAAMLHEATVTVNSLGLVAPPGAGGGPVTGTATGTIA